MASVRRFWRSFRASLLSLSPSSPPLSPLVADSSLTAYDLLKKSVRNVEHLFQTQATKFKSQLSAKLRIQNCSNSGKCIILGSLLGVSTIVGCAKLRPYIAESIDDEEHNSSFWDPSRYLENDPDSLPEWVKRLWLPVVLVWTVLRRWEHPLYLIVDVILFLIATRPSPSSVYLYIEQLRRQAIRKDPSFRYKIIYARKVEVEDYKVLCLANVEVIGRKFTLVGILGSWWIL